jgi:hypothetical protein
MNQGLSAWIYLAGGIIFSDPIEFTLSGNKPMGKRLEIRLESGEKAAYDKAARIAGMDRSE